jgi:hypothetical protein
MWQAYVFAKSDRRCSAKTLHSAFIVAVFSMKTAGGRRVTESTAN